MEKRSHYAAHSHSIEFLRAFEWFTDLIIPYLLIVLAIELLIDNPLWSFYDLHHLEPLITYFDYFILFFFVTDLVFKWFHVRNVVKFVKLYWLDILAVLPFYFAFRIYARIASLVTVGEEIAEAQKVAHELVLAREARLLREAELIAREEVLLREARPLTRFIRTMERGLRFLSGRNEVASQGMAHAILKGEH